MKSVWIEAWEAASVLLIRAKRISEGEDGEDDQQDQAVQGVGDVAAHSEPAGAADGCDGQDDGDLGERGIEGHSGHLAAGLHAKNVPGDTSTQTLAADAGLALNGWAVLGGHALACTPHAGCALRDADTIGKSTDTTRYRDGLLECFHSVVRGGHVVP